MKKVYSICSLFFGLILFANAVSGQNVGINDTNANPDASAMLDVKSSSKGMLVPRMNSAQRTGISNAAVGLLVFDTQTESFWFKASAGWTELVNNPVKTIRDTDGDTKIQTEEGANDNTIRFDVAGNERWTMRDERLEPQNAGNSVFIGKDAGHSGSNNVQIGYQAGKNATGSNNIFIGKDAGINEAGSNRLFVGPLLYGETDNALLRVNGTLNINNEYSLPSTDGSANQVLQTNGNGVVSWANQSGGGSVPIGTVLPYAGHIEDDGTLKIIDGGYLLCNGAIINSASGPYANLATVIDQYWGDNDGMLNTVNLPDLRGMFLRGVNGARNDGKQDPDGGARDSMLLNGTGVDNHVGSYQNDVFKSHNHGGGNHTHPFPNEVFVWAPGSGTNDIGESNTDTISHPMPNSGVIINTEGGNETRPRNAYIHYIIKY